MIETLASVQILPETRAALGHAEAWAVAVRALHEAYVKALNGPTGVRAAFRLELRRRKT